MSKLTQILSSGIAAVALASSASSAFAQTTAKPPLVSPIPACDKAYRDYMGATVNRGLMNVNSTIEHLADGIPSGVNGANAKKQDAADAKYHAALRNNGIDDLTEAAAKVGMACGATPNEVLATANAKHAGTKRTAKPTP